MAPTEIPLLDTFAAQEARAIAHNLLKNRIRAQDSAESLRGSLKMARESGECLHNEVLRRLHCLLEEILDPVRGMSPAQLIDRLPAFVSVSESDREEMRKKVHIQFLTEFDIEGFKAVFRAEIGDFETSMAALLTMKSESLGSDSAFESVNASARRLTRHLAEIGRGAWLWPR